MLHILDQQNTVLNKFMEELRDCEVQRDRMRFRRNMERIGEILAYEISKTFHYVNRSVETPLGTAEVAVPDDDVVLAAILRSGLPLHTGFLNYFDRAESAFISAYRHYKKDGSIKIEIDTIISPDLSGKTLVLIDPLLATGTSVEDVYKALVKMGGEPAALHIASVLASEDGVEYVKEKFGAKADVWTVAVDAELTVKSYIVPGIGDTGDLAYGEKI